jgi:hypothetical protein
MARRTEVAGHATAGEASEGGSAMRVTRWALLVLVGLLVAGCASPTPLPPSATVAPSSTSVPTIAPTLRQAQGTALPPTSTIAPTPTRPAPTATPTEAPGAVTITILYDNNEYDERLKMAWGFACLVEGPEKTILFDTGRRTTPSPSTCPSLSRKASKRLRGKQGQNWSRCMMRSRSASSSTRRGNLEMGSRSSRW